jgi:hypothetical protein
MNPRLALSNPLIIHSPRRMAMTRLTAYLTALIFTLSAGSDAEEAAMQE